MGSRIIKRLRRRNKNDITILEDVAETLQNDRDLEPFYKIIESDINQIKTLQKSLDNWDKAYETSGYIRLVDWSKKKVESEIKDEAKKMRDMVKARFNKKREKTLIADSKQCANDLYNMYKKLHKLEILINEFDKRFASKKRERNIVDFTDVEHFAYHILINQDDKGNVSTTDIAKKVFTKI